MKIRSSIFVLFFVSSAFAHDQVCKNAVEGLIYQVRLSTQTMDHLEYTNADFQYRIQMGEFQQEFIKRAKQTVAKDCNLNL